MKVEAILLLSLISLSGLASKTAGAICDPSTCPDAPVQVTFEYSNCTGAMSFSSLENYWNICVSTATASGLSFYDAHGWGNYDSISNLICDVESDNSSYTLNFNYFGTCYVGRGARDARGEEIETLNGVLFHHAERRDLSGATMYLLNANATFESPQEPWTEGNLNNLTSFGLVAVTDCVPADNCTLPNGEHAPIYQTLYAESGNCSSDIVRRVMYPGFELDSCQYVVANTFARVSCISEKSIAITYYSGPDCNRALDVVTQRITCESHLSYSPAFNDIYCSLSSPTPAEVISPFQGTPSSPPLVEPVPSSPSPTSSASWIIPGIPSLVILSFMLL